jgi:hypothetical protein
VAGSFVQSLGKIGAKRPRKRKTAASKSDVYAPLNGSAGKRSVKFNDPIPFSWLITIGAAAVGLLGTTPWLI